MKLVTISEERFLELIDVERSAESCKECGPIAQRDRRIAALEKERDDLVRENYAMRRRIEHDLSGGIHELKNKSDKLQKKYELAAACIGGVSNILQSRAGDAPQSAMARIRDYYNDLEVVEKEVSS